MSAPLKGLSRTLSTTPAAIRARAVVSTYGADTSGYTATGGSGEDATTQSKSLAEASGKARATYRSALRAIPSMRANFTIMEDDAVIRGVIRDLFGRHAGVSDPAIVDMLVFKARQELREIREQWKSRHHLYKYIVAYMDKLHAEEIVRAASGGEERSMEARHAEMLLLWKERGLVPGELQTWAQFQRWREEENEKFAAFALENKVFSNEELERGRKAKSVCSVM